MQLRPQDREIGGMEVRSARILADGQGKATSGRVVCRSWVWRGEGFV